MPKVPHPRAVAEAVARVRKTTETTFEIDIQGWRTVWLTELVPFRNPVRPELSLLFAKPVLVVATPYLPSLDGRLALSIFSLQTSRASYWPGTAESLTILLQRTPKTVGFRACNKHSENWLRLRLAQAAKMRFRRHGLVDPTKIVYYDA